MTDLACIPSAIPTEERAGHFALARRILTELVRERRDLPNGFAFRFDVDALELVARFVANERKCCPFIDFEIGLARDGGPLWLQMTGPAGTREVLTAELRAGAGDCC
jgi:hypothetical protein